MCELNFDSDFYNRILSENDNVQYIPSLNELIQEAIKIFYNEYDYYPDIAVCSPGKFNIMGDHVDYFGGNIAQAALPLMTVIVGKKNSTLKCRILTSSDQIDKPQKIVFPLPLRKRLKKGFPTWANVIKGVMNNFPKKDLFAFDAVVHSNIPFGKNLGAEISLEIALYKFLEVEVKEECRRSDYEKALFCKRIKEKYGGSKLGAWDSFTSVLAKNRDIVLTNCRKARSKKCSIWDSNILFLLTIPTKELEVDEKNLKIVREAETRIAAKLLSLSNVICVKERHLGILENMECPTREKIIEVMEGLKIDKEIRTRLLNEFDFEEPQTAENLEGEMRFEEINIEGNENVDLRLYGEDTPKNVELVNEKFEEPQTAENLEGETGLEKINIEGNENVDERLYGEDTPKNVELENEKMESTADLPKPQSVPQVISENENGKKPSTIMESADQGKTFQKVCQGEIINCLGGIDDLSSSEETSLNSRLMRRLRHVISENSRSLSLATDVTCLNYVELGYKLVHSHLSLKSDYEICSPELDQLVQLVMEVENVYGAKMISGGATLTLLRRDSVENVVNAVTDKFGKNFTFYLAFPSEGARTIKLNIKNSIKSELSHGYPNLEDLILEAVENFDAVYTRSPTHGSVAPGVINLIGDHTDYNQGFTLPMAVGLLTVVVGAVNGTAKIRVFTTADVGYDKRKAIFPIPQFKRIQPGSSLWAKYVKGVIQNFNEPLPGFDCLIHSSIPLDCGIGSTAALEVAMYTFLEELSGFKTEKLDLKSYLCMKAEHEYTKSLCGITKQTVAVRAKKDFAIFLDCRTPDITYVPFQNPSVAMVLICLEIRLYGGKSMLLSRLEECYSVAKYLNINDLSEFKEKDLKVLENSQLGETAVKRAKHVITENNRTKRAVKALKNNDYDTFGRIMVESHISLRDNYEVSSRDLDFLVECAMEVDGVLGSKMIGNGYGVSTITLVRRWAIDDLIEYILHKYEGNPRIYLLEPFEGTKPIDVKKYASALHPEKYTFENVFPL